VENSPHANARTTSATFNTIWRYRSINPVKQSHFWSDIHVVGVVAKERKHTDSEHRDTNEFTPFQAIITNGKN